MEINKNVRPLRFIGEDGFELEISRSNMGEPYRDGIDFSLSNESDYTGGFLELSEVERLHKFLGEYLNKSN